MKRDDRLDVLRGIGLLCIVLAHIVPPAIIFQMRNFDVPLMVLVAGSAFAISAQSRPRPGYIEYIKNRFNRLVIPTWIFLAIFFFITLMASSVMHKSFPFSSHTILSSFLLLDGIGYVWIIRVFLLVSLIAPFTLMYAEYNDTARRKIVVAMIALYVIYEILVRFIPDSNHLFLHVLLNDILYMLIPYGCIFFLGTRLHAMSGRKLFSASLILFVLFVAYIAVLYKLHGHIIPTQNYKYPPTAYYILYAMFASFSLYWLSQTEIYSRIPGKNYVSFLGRSSMWIYLWHISILYLINWSHININLAVKYIVVLGSAVSLVMLQSVILDKVLVTIDSQRTKKIFKAVFSG